MAERLRTNQTVHVTGSCCVLCLNVGALFCGDIVDKIRVGETNSS